MLSAESKVLAERRGVLEAQRRSFDVPRSAQSLDPARIARDLPRALRLIRAWVEEADGADFDLVLRALNAQIVASSEAIEVREEVPLIAKAPQSFATIERTWESLFNGGEIAVAPFRLAVSLVDETRAATVV